MAAKKSNKKTAAKAKAGSKKTSGARTTAKKAGAKKKSIANEPAAKKRVAKKTAVAKKPAAKASAAKRGEKKKSAAKRRAAKRPVWSASNLFDFVRIGNARLSPDDFVGFDVDTRDDEGKTLLHHAMTPVPQMGKDTAALTRFLLARGLAVDATDQSGATPLVVAAMEGQLEALKLLHARGARVDVSVDGGSVLHLIAEQQQNRPIDVTMTIERDGEQVELTDPDEIRAATGFHPDDKFLGSIACARWLIENGLRADLRHPERKQTALFSAAHHGAKELVAMFLEHGCPADDTDAWGLTPLHYACRSGDVDVVRLLVEHGARVDATDDLGFTPLHEAAESGRADVAHFLLERGASLDAQLRENVDRYPKGSTPRDVARIRKRENVFPPE